MDGYLRRGYKQLGIGAVSKEAMSVGPPQYHGHLVRAESEWGG